MKKVIWFVLVLASLAAWLLISDAVWKYLFFLRQPILMGLFLLLLPKLAKDWLPAMLKNLFVLRSKWQLAVIIGSAIGAGISVVSVASIILHNAPARFDVPAAIEIPEFLQYGIAIALSSYICIVAIDLSQEKLKNDERQWGVIAGVGLSIGLLFIVNLLKQWLSSNAFLNKIFVEFIYFLSKHKTDGYINSQTGELTAGHLTAIAYLIIGVAIYITVGLRFNPKPQTNRPEAPALLYLLVIISIITLVYGGATFYFDYFRVPVLILFLIFSAFTYVGFGTNHFFQLDSFQENEGNKRVDSDSGDFKQVIEKRLQHQTGERTLVVVCASGGGIQAAGWTAQVLTGLQQNLGTSFTQAIGLISAVSGGSVGTMYYLDRFNKNGFLELKKDKYKSSDRTTKDSFDAATADTLDAVGWGLAYLDLWRFMGFPFMVHQKFDRGTALEIDWQSEMKEPKKIKTLATWRKQIFDGEIPIPIFNATLVENGWRFLISPLTFGKVIDKNYVDFNSLYGTYDMDVVTAARLSATFPYVTPICRNSINIPDSNYHVADGGYFDNSGFVTAAEWLDEWLKPEKNLNIKRVLVLQINAFPKYPSKKVQENTGWFMESLRPLFAMLKEQEKGNPGWFMATLGPLLAMFKVRDPVLASRNAQEADLLAKKWENQVEIQYFPIFFPSESEISSECAVTEFYRDGRYRPPLSWRLTDREKQAIKDGWTTIKAGENIQKIKQLWHETWKMSVPTEGAPEDYPLD
ncbi:patatin-like phospholipase family protein [Tolypothrix sp. VBCCA 56010]|uniref:patatin-like phospholipase family protein n=1 Tax=Tolypothrix sp. VBCCA 56010 TaxID=3137731 RepID=UPI003D7E76D4